MKHHPLVSREGHKEIFSGVLGGLLVLGLIAAFIGAWMKIGSPDEFARAMDLVQNASSIIAVVIGYFFGAAQSRAGIAVAHSEAEIARARLEGANATIDKALERYEMRGGAGPGAPPLVQDEAYELLRAYADQRDKRVLHGNGSGGGHAPEGPGFPEGGQSFSPR